MYRLALRIASGTARRAPVPAIVISRASNTEIGYRTAGIPPLLPHRQELSPSSLRGCSRLSTTTTNETISRREIALELASQTPSQPIALVLRSVPTGSANGSACFITSQMNSVGEMLAVRCDQLVSSIRNLKLPPF